MVIKTRLCAFSEGRIYPGHGMQFIRKDGQPVQLFGSKEKSLYDQRKKPAKITWTQAWRRLNKKATDQMRAKKRTRRVVKIQRAIVGMNLDEIKKKRNQKPEVRKAARDLALQEIKARKSKKKGRR
jgi:large subunit ribosomal protein L24e|eukprot:g11954.t1